MLEHKASVTGVSFSPDGETIATASAPDTVFSLSDKWSAAGAYDDDSKAILWDASSEVGKKTTLIGHTNKVTDVQFSPDGRTVVTTSGDTTVRLWNAADGTTLAVLRGHSAPYGGGVQFQGNAILSVANDGAGYTLES